MKHSATTSEDPGVQVDEAFDEPTEEMALTPEEEKEEELNQSAACTVAQLKALFGPGPVLKHENQADYDRILLDLVRAGWGGDIIKLMLIRDIANALWWDRRYERSKAHALEHPGLPKPGPDSALLQISGPNAGNAGLSNERLEGRTVANNPALTAADRAAAELACGDAFREQILYMERIDNLQSTNNFRRNNSVHLWREYRAGSIPAAYVIRKEHAKRAERAVADRNENIDRLIKAATVHAERRQLQQDPPGSAALSGEKGLPAAGEAPPASPSPTESDAA